MPARLERACGARRAVDREGAEARGGRDRAALVHEARERGRRAADRPDVGLAGAAVRRRRRRRARRCPRSRPPRPPWSRARAGRCRWSALDVDAVRAGHAGGHRGGVARRRCRRARRARAARRGSARPRAPAPAPRRPRPTRDAAEHRAHGHGLVGLHEDLGERAGDGRGHLGVDLVGRDLDERPRRPPRSPTCLSHSSTVPSVDGVAHLAGRRRPRARAARADSSDGASAAGAGSTGGRAVGARTRSRRAPCPPERSRPARRGSSSGSRRPARALGVDLVGRDLTSGSSCLDRDRPPA